MREGRRKKRCEKNKTKTTSVGKRRRWWMFSKQNMVEARHLDVSGAPDL